MKIAEGKLQDLEWVYQRLLNDFAADELKDFHQLDILMRSKTYKLFLAMLEETEQIVGYALVFEPENIDALWLDYLAIEPGVQGSGFGTEFFKQIQKKQKGMFIEVEIPEQQEGIIRETQIRRIRFYERLGAKKLKVPYLLPTKDGGLPMYLYYRPANHETSLPKQKIMQAIKAAFDTIHSDITNKDTTINMILPSAKDEYFSNIWKKYDYYVEE